MSDNCLFTLRDAVWAHRKRSYIIQKNREATAIIWADEAPI